MAKHSDYMQPTGETLAFKQVWGHPLDSFEDDLDHVLGKVKDLLMAKNAAYGDAALNPLRVHSKSNPVEQLKVRMDDKLSRMIRGKSAGEDATLDYVGYYFMLKIAELREGTA